MRLIDADALTAQMEADAEHMEEPVAKMFTFAAINDIKHAPTIEPKKGKWINDADDWPYPECSVCGKNALEVQEWGFKSNYCPHCGARMENSEEK